VSCHEIPSKVRYATRTIVLFDSYKSEPILIAQHVATPCFLRPDKFNRHGIITGATGTSKTITLQTMAEVFSRFRVPVFMADIKGDLKGISPAGTRTPRLTKVIVERERER
jgi:hypothetical protein